MKIFFVLFVCVVFLRQILVLTGIILCGGSYAFLTFWRRRRERDDELFAPQSWEDEMVYKVSFGICAFSLAVSVGAALLLPVSTISNEILHRYPSSWYIKWLNGSLIQGSGRKGASRKEDENCPSPS